MRALIVTPAPPGSRAGNRVTASRWAEVLASLGHDAAILEAWQGEPCHLLVALHARKSAPSVAAFRDERGAGAPLVVALTGTDLYGDLATDADARRALELADRLVVLHPLAAADLPEHVRGKVRPILQSVPPVGDAGPRRTDRFEVVVMGHLRPVKDPFRGAEAARLLPASSRIAILQVGAALSPDLAERARREAKDNPRYEWLGELERDDALRVLARSRLLLLTSLLEGGANVVGEAVVNGVPVVSTRIAGSVGLLGSDYPGYFPVGDTAACAALLRRAEDDPGFYAELRERCARVAPLFAPEREREAWRGLVAELLARSDR